jgi:putative endonuclease
VHHVYIVRCADGSLYTGYARDPARRVDMHNSGRGARYTSGRRPVHLVHSESFDAVGDALKREHELKRWTRRKKEALIAASRPSADYRISSVGGTSGTMVVARKTANTNASRNVASTTCGPTPRT